MNNLSFLPVLLFLLTSISCAEGAQTPIPPESPREVADAYLEAARSGDVEAVEQLSTEGYKKRAKKETGRFQRFAKCTFTTSEAEEESEGTWHLFSYSCEGEGAEKEDVVIAVIEENGKSLVGDVD